MVNRSPAGSAPSPRTSPPARDRRTARLRGRDAELEVIGEHLGAVASGRGGVLLLEGPPGIGRSRLVAEARTMARRAGVRALSGQAYEGQQAIAFAPLLAAMQDGDPALGPVVTVRSLGEHPDLRYWLLDELHGALEAAALDGPLALLLDDLQWADAGTLAAVSALAPRLEDGPVLWVLAARSTERRAAAGQALARLEAAGARRLRLGALPQDAVAAMIADLLGAPPDPALAALAAYAGGRPAVLVELLEGLREEGRLRETPGRLGVDGDALPRRAADSVADRLDRLSADTRTVLRAASVLGPRFSVAALAAVLGRRPTTLVGAFEEAVEAGLLVASGERLAFRHELLCRAVFETLARPLRRALRREAATALLDAGGEPVEAAAMLAESAEVGDREAIGRLRAIARGVADSDASAAADLSLRALELLPAGDGDRGPLLAETVTFLHSAVRPHDARRLGDGALAQPLPLDHEAEIRLSLSRMLMSPSLVRVQENRRALELPSLSPVMRARHLGWLAFNLAPVAPGEAVTAAGSAMAAAEATGDLQARVMATLARISVDNGNGHPARAVARVEGLRRLTRNAPPEAYLPIADFYAAWALAGVGRMDEALELATEGAARGRRERNAWLLESWAQVSSGLRLAAGQLAAAHADAGAARRGRWVADGILVGAIGVATLGQVALHTGDAAGQRDAERAAHRLLGAGSAPPRRLAAWSLALAAMARGDAAAAARWLADDELPYAAPRLPADPGQEPAVARIAVAAGTPELARRAVEVAETRERENPGIPLIAAVARHTRGLVEGDAAKLLDAARMLRDTQRPLLHAAAAEDAGRALARAERLEEAVAALAEALGGYLGCGAAADARRVRRLLRDHGVRPRVAAQERSTSGWASLTESELRVVRLVAGGASNRDAAEQLFLSPHTVSSHLRHSFVKLGIRSRYELTRVALAEEGASGALR